MTAPQAVLAIWHDTDPDMAGDIQHWYNRQHHPERLSVPGFLQARRHRVVGSGPAIFIVYDVEDTAVLRSAAYLDRVNNPTDWTRRCMPHFRNNMRTVCRVAASLGAGAGGSVATLRMAAEPGAEDELSRAIRRAMAEFMEQPFSVSAQHWVADEESTAIHSAECVLRGVADVITPSVLVLTASDPQLVAAAAEQLGSVGGLVAKGARSIDAELYALQFSMSAD